jgi:Leucine-rich repeat (LRR) protein
MKKSNIILRHFTDLIELELSEGDEITGSVCLENFKNLTELNLSRNSRITDSDLKKLTNLRILGMLRFRDNK